MQERIGRWRGQLWRAQGGGGGEGSRGEGVVGSNVEFGVELFADVGVTHV